MIQLDIRIYNGANGKTATCRKVLDPKYVLAIQRLSVLDMTKLDDTMPEPKIVKRRRKGLKKDLVGPIVDEMLKII